MNSNITLVILEWEQLAYIFLYNIYYLPLIGDWLSNCNFKLDPLLDNRTVWNSLSFTCWPARRICNRKSKKILKAFIGFQKSIRFEKALLNLYLFLIMFSISRKLVLIDTTLFQKFYFRQGVLLCSELKRFFLFFNFSCWQDYGGNFWGSAL